jgi:hypothetical protein
MKISFEIFAQILKVMIKEQRKKSSQNKILELKSKFNLLSYRCISLSI